MRGKLPLLVAISLAAVVAHAPRADAQCVQVGTSVTCSGVDPDGFVATEDALDIQVEDTAVVEDGGAPNTSAIGALDSSGVTVFNGGQVNATGDGSVGVSAEVFTGVGNGGSITSSGVNGVGVSVGETSGVENTGLISASGAGGVGVQLGTGAVARNRNGGTISGTQLAIEGDAGANRVENHGGATIDGDVDLAAGNDRFIAHTGSTLNGMVDGGSGIDGLDLATGTVLDGAFDLDRIQNFEELTVNGSDSIHWKLSGTGTFINGATVVSGNLEFEPGTVLGGPLEVADGELRVDVPVSLPGGLTTTGGITRLQDGANITGDVTIDGGLAIVSGDVALPTSFEMSRGSTIFVGTDVTGGAVVSGGNATLRDGVSFTGPVAVSGGAAAFSDALSFGGGLSMTGGVATFTDSDVTGIVSLSDSTVRLEGASTFANLATLTNDTTTLAAGSSTTGNLVVDGGSLVLGGDASLVGDLTQTGGSRFDTEIDQDGSHLRLTVTGQVALDDAILTLRTADDEPFTSAQTYAVLTATDGITGEFQAIEFDGAGSGFLGASAAYGPAFGPSAVQVTAGVSFIAPARTDNQFAVGQHLDLAAQGATSVRFQSYLDSLTALDTTAAISALDALHPESYDAHTSAALATGTEFADLLATRPIRCERYVSPYRPGRPSEPPCSRRGFAGWVEAFGRFAERNGRPGFRDWSYGGGGLALGVDHEIGDAFVVSGMLGTSRTALRFDGDGDGSITTFDFGGAVAWRHEATHIRGVFEYGHGWHDTRRKVEYPGFSQLNTSDHDSDRVTLLVEAGHELRYGPLEVEPLLSLDYTWLREGSVNETKNNVTALSIGSRENVLVAGEAGVRVGATLVKYGYFGDLLEWADGVWRPEVTARWRQVFNDYDRASSARLREAPAGTPQFRTVSEDAQYGAEFGAGLSFQPHGTRNTIHLGYETFVGNRTLVHSLMGTVRIPF